MSYKVDYIPWLERERERLTFRNKKIKAERDTLIDDLKTLRKLSEALKASENSLWLSSREFECERDELAAKVSRLEQIRDIKDSALKGADIKIKTLERENEKLRKANSNGWKQKDEVINKLISNIKSKDNLLSEISQHIGNKPSSSTYKYFRAKLDGLGIEEGE